MRSGPALPLRVQVAIAIVAGVFCIWILPAITSWLKANAATTAPVQTYALVTVRCPIAESGALFIATIRVIDDKIVAGDCVEVVSRGVYGTKARK